MDDLFLVREMRVELTCLAAHASETCASTNSAIPAKMALSKQGRKYKTRSVVFPFALRFYQKIYYTLQNHSK